MNNSVDPKYLILFDYDGVLVDSMPFNLQVVSEVLSRLGYTEFPTIEYCRNADCISLEEWARRIDMADVHLAEFVSEAHQRFAAGAADLPLFTGILELLTALNREHKLALITANVSSAARAFLARHGIDQHFFEIVGVETKGSKADKIRKCIADGGYSLEQVYYVGDTGTDVQQGKAAGVKTVAVTWGFQGRDRLAKENPDYLIDSMDELSEIFLENVRL